MKSEEIHHFLCEVIGTRTLDKIILYYIRLNIKQIFFLASSLYIYIYITLILSLHLHYKTLPQNDINSIKLKLKNEGQFCSKLMSMVVVIIIIDDIMVTFCGWQEILVQRKLLIVASFLYFQFNLRYGFPSL